MGRPTAIIRSQLLFYSAGLLALLAFSGWKAYDAATWATEVAPVFAMMVPLWLTLRRFPMVAQWPLARWHDRQRAALKRASLR